MRTGRSQGLQCHVETDLVSVLEAIGNRLGHSIDSQLYSVTLDLLDAIGIGAARHLDHP